MPLRRARPQPSPVFRNRLLLLTLLSPLLLISSLHLFSAVLRHANDLGRRCQPDPPYFALSGSAASHTLRIAMVSFSDEGGGGGEGRPPLRRSFRGVTAVVGRSKRTYAARMGYDFVDAGGLVDPSRPPSWSKIPAVRSRLSSHDWVFWNDADTVVTNSDISLVRSSIFDGASIYCDLTTLSDFLFKESILRAIIGQDDFINSPNLVMTEDINGINAGVFFVRRSKWSENFLDSWWNQSSFVQFGSTKSGDNDALKYLIKNLPSNELRENVRISPMQCLFNSYPWYPSWKSFYQLIFSPGAVWRGAYSRGDFMVHLAGLDDKKEWAVKILHELEAEKMDYLYQARRRPFL